MGDETLYQVRLWLVASLSAFITLLLLHAFKIRARIHRNNDENGDELVMKTIPEIMFDMLTLELFERRIKIITFWSCAIGMIVYIFYIIIKRYLCQTMI